MHISDVKWCVISPKYINAYFKEDAEISYSPWRDSLIKVDKFIERDNRLVIEGQETINQLEFGRMWLTDFHASVIKSSDVKYGYKYPWDWFKKKKTPYVKGWYSLKEKKPFKYTSTKYEIFYQ